MFEELDLWIADVVGMVAGVQPASQSTLLGCTDTETNCTGTCSCKCGTVDCTFSCTGTDTAGGFTACGGCEQ